LYIRNERNMNQTEWTLSHASEIVQLIKITENDDELSLDFSELDENSTRTLEAPIYWSAPKVFTGNKVTSYGGKISYSLIIREPKVQGVYYQSKSDVILVGENMILVHSTNSKLVDDKQFLYEVDLLENNFNHLKSNFKADRADLMQVLSSLKEIKIR
jgi:hypothetical protein